MAVVGSQGGADLVVRDDGEVDQEPEDPRPQEVPEPDRHQEHDRPAVREWRAERDSCLAPSCKKLHASTVRNVRGMTSAAEKNAPIAMCSAGVPEKYRWCMVPITPRRIQQDVQEDDGQGYLLSYHTEKDEEDVGDHDGGKGSKNPPPTGARPRSARSLRS